MYVADDDAGMDPTNCPKCNSENIYSDGTVWTCPECFHEWTGYEPVKTMDEDSTGEDQTIRDANGNPLADGDSVIVIKELKIKGSSSVVKVGTKVKNIRLTDAGDGHDIACRIDGIGAINLKSEYVRKS